MYVMLEEKLLIFIFIFLMDPYESEDSLYTCKDFRWFSPNGMEKDGWMYLL